MCSPALDRVVQLVSRGGGRLGQRMQLRLHVVLLAEVETLCLDAGLEIYRHCAPAWGGEDDLFDIHSLDDLALLPNLKRVTAVDDGTLVAPGK
ncbi:DUF6892 domain-containing protein [Streptomyces sp. enrichment culture]|uniref:DUF6892 domain-containing protein n=1 Tax=Streptomyces sp. enrichment culture TaxID=1795815 RepID=UPI003F55CC37